MTLKHHNSQHSCASIFAVLVKTKYFATKPRILKYKFERWIAIYIRLTARIIKLQTVGNISAAFKDLQICAHKMANDKMVLKSKHGQTFQSLCAFVVWILNSSCMKLMVMTAQFYECT